jgi:DNA-directed RNA polymerase III subunit RPC7
VKSQPSLKRKDLHEPFFPQEILEDYFNPRRKQKSTSPLPQVIWDWTLVAHLHAKQSKAKLNLDEIVEDGDEQVYIFIPLTWKASIIVQEKSTDERSEVGSQAESDYDVDEEYDNDYAENYFDNGEGDDLDDLGGGAGGDDGGGKLVIHSTVILFNFVEYSWLWLTCIIS